MLLFAAYACWMYGTGVALCRTVSAAVVAACYTGSASPAPADVAVAGILARVCARHAGTLLAAAAVAPASALLRALASPVLTPRQMLAWCAPETRGDTRSLPVPEHRRGLAVSHGGPAWEYPG